MDLKEDGTPVTYSSVLANVRPLYARISAAHTEMMKAVINQPSDIDTIFEEQGMLIEKAALEIADEYLRLGSQFNRRVFANMIQNLASDVARFTATKWR
jgi:hypothetical protein